MSTIIWNLLVVLIGAEYNIEVSMRKEDASSKEVMRLFISELFDFSDMIFFQMKASESLN